MLLATLVAVGPCCRRAMPRTSTISGGVIFGSSSTPTAVANDLGSQAVAPARQLLADYLGPALVFLGLFGFAALAAAAPRYSRTPSRVLAAGTVLAWCALMYVGSRTSLDGFPARFERDVGAPLSITAAFGALP